MNREGRRNRSLIVLLNHFHFRPGFIWFWVSEVNCSFGGFWSMRDYPTTEAWSWVLWKIASVNGIERCLFSPVCESVCLTRTEVFAVSLNVTPRLNWRLMVDCWSWMTRYTLKNLQISCFQQKSATSTYINCLVQHPVCVLGIALFIIRSRPRGK